MCCGLKRIAIIARKQMKCSGYKTRDNQAGSPCLRAPARVGASDRICALAGHYSNCNGCSIAMLSGHADEALSN